MATGLGRPVKPGPGLVFLAVWKKFYRGDQDKIVILGLQAGPGRAEPGKFGPVATLGCESCNFFL